MAFADIKRRNEYDADYKREHYDRIEVRVRKGCKSLVKSAADAAEESVGIYIKKAVSDRLRADGFTVPDDF